jgi:hypothetical protein
MMMCVPDLSQSQAFSIAVCWLRAAVGIEGEALGLQRAFLKNWLAVPAQPRFGVFTDGRPAGHVTAGTSAPAAISKSSRPKHRSIFYRSVFLSDDQSSRPPASLKVRSTAPAQRRRTESDAKPLVTICDFPVVRGGSQNQSLLDIFP